MLCHEATRSGALLLVFAIDVELRLFAPLVQPYCYPHSSVNAVAALAVKKRVQGVGVLQQSVRAAWPLPAHSDQRQNTNAIQVGATGGTPGTVLARNVDITTALLMVVPATINRKVHVARSFACSSQNIRGSIRKCVWDANKTGMQQTDLTLAHMHGIATTRVRTLQHAGSLAGWTDRDT